MNHLSTRELRNLITSEMKKDPPKEKGLEAFGVWLARKLQSAAKP